MVEAFSERVRGGEAWLPPLADARAGAAVLDAIRAVPDTTA
jgi:hypothetical protein